MTERLSDALERALSQQSGPGRVVAASDGRSVEVDVIDVDRLGARVRGVHVVRSAPFDLERLVEEAPDVLRDLPERVIPVEVDPTLGGATLRSRPAEVRDHTYTDVEIRGSEARVFRHRRVRGTDPEPADWTLTREQLGRVVDALAGPGMSEASTKA
jgi:hypothetical protein